MATKTKRFEFRAEDHFVEELERLAIASGTTKAQVIDRAIGLYAEALRQAEEGKDIYFMAEDEAKHLAHA
jgi:hypothetical protein